MKDKPLETAVPVEQLSSRSEASAQAAASDDRVAIGQAAAPNSQAAALGVREATGHAVAPSAQVAADAASSQTAATDAEETAKLAKKKRLGYIDTILSVLVKLLLFGLAIWATFTFVFGIMQVEGQAMAPSVKDGDVVLYYRLANNYVAKDAVAYDHNDRTLVSRIVAQGGDVVDISKDKKLIVNGNVLDEEVFFPTEALAGGISYPYTVPTNSYFLVSDNRTGASDSRSFGAVPASDLRGKVTTVMRQRGI